MTPETLTRIDASPDPVRAYRRGHMTARGDDEGLHTYEELLARLGWAPRHPKPLI
jgi:hypothetical protein